MAQAVTEGGEATLVTRPDPGRTAGAPAPAPGLVERPRLVARLEAAVRDGRVVLVSAPVGYGKTTLLAQWAATTTGHVVWLTADTSHDDAVVFVRDLTAALAEVGPEGEPPPRVGTDDGPALTSRGLPRIARWVRGARPFTLVVDEAERLGDPVCRDVLRAVGEALPAGAALIVAGRGGSPLPVASLRATRRLAEFGAADLAMDAGEARALFDDMGVRPGPDRVQRLVEVTEGWPAGLVVAGLAMADDPLRTPFSPDAESGDWRIGDLVTEEVLAHIPPGELEFLTRTAILDSLTSESCTAVLGRPVGDEELRALARRNRFVIAVDATGRRFRYHGLFAGILREELERTDPGTSRELHRRAAMWHRGRGDHLDAVRHLRAAGRDDEAAGLVWASLPALQPSGRIGTLRQMIAQFSDDEVRASAPLALARAWTSVDDRSDMVAHWARVARLAGYEGALPGGPSSVETAVVLLQATIAASGARAMGDDAAAAYAAEPDASPWRALACFLIGAAASLRDDAASASAALEEGVERSGDALPSIHMLCETWMAAIGLIADEPEAAARHAARAVRQVARAGLEDYSSTGLLYAVRAVVAARDGDADAALEHVRKGRLLLANTREIFPGFGILSRVLLARAAARTGDPATARTLLREAQELHRRLPDSPLVDRLLTASAGIAGGNGARSAGSAALTTAELRVLTFLTTHLSLKEIALRLGSSPHTVKSQAAAVYRKLGASSRSEAVEAGRMRGLIEP